jgi:import inner membrane translocase subunit TIM44
MLVLRVAQRQSRSLCARVRTAPTRLRPPPTRTFATTKPDEERNRTADTTESFQDTIHRLQNEENEKVQDSGSNEKSSTRSILPDNFLATLADQWGGFRKEVGHTWNELVRSGQRKDINKKIHPVATAEGEKPYTGPVEIMVIEEAEHLTAWERMQKRLTAAPIIQDILSRTEEIYDKSGARDAKARVDHIREDAKEAWETSQNPWVYRVSSVYDTLTAESPETRAVKELRQLDPEFTLEDWKADVVEHTLPQIMQWFLEGRINQLKPWLGEGVFKRLAAEMTAREKEGVQIDTNLLGIMNSEILAIEPDEVNRGSPIIILHFMAQQINCVKKKKDDEIVEGAEDDIRANSYVTAFQREYDEEKGELNWKIVDFRFNGAIAYL